MARRCSHCNHNGHNSRTCPNRGVKLFGVHLTDGSVRKSASMGNLSLLAGSSGGASPADGPEPGSGAAGGGYASEDFVKGSSSSCRERKKGTPWTEEEHRMFLLGLQKLGKGDWRVHSKTLMNIDELVGMSKLSIGESRGSSLDLLGRSKRQSAFHASPSTKAQA
ncbi:hypothetical protein BHE74_00011623 [Ensete ventricosum]|nr:hypothetical protein BHE74_00011623 [Ensete ventricosum]